MALDHSANPILLHSFLHSILHKRRASVVWTLWVGLDHKETEAVDKIMGWDTVKQWIRSLLRRDWWRHGKAVKPFALTQETLALTLTNNSWPMLA